MKKTFLAFGILAFLGTTSAMAADVVAPAPAFNWAGPYVGVVGSYGFGSTLHTDDLGITSGDFNMGGPLGGVEAGYNFQSNKLVWGLEGDLSISGDKGHSTVPVCVIGCDTNINWLSTVRGRVGFTANNLLFYGTGGLAIGGLSVDASKYTGSATNIGYAVGGGAEVGLSPNLTAKLQYLYVNLGSVTYNNSGVPITARADNNHIVSVGLNYKF